MSGKEKRETDMERRKKHLQVGYLLIILDHAPNKQVAYLYTNKNLQATMTWGSCTSFSILLYLPPNRMIYHDKSLIIFSYPGFSKCC